MEVKAQVNNSFGQRFVQYFINRKGKLAFFSVIALVMYVASRRGYIKKLLSYALSKASERISKQIEQANAEMEKQHARSEDFGNTLKAFSEKFPTLSMNYLIRQFDDIYHLENIKESLKNKNLSAADKTKNWQSFRDAVCKSTLLIIVSKSYLWSAWLIRDILQAKLKNETEELIKTISTKDAKLVSDSISSTHDFINNFVEGIISHTLQSFVEIIGKLSAELECKLNDKISIDDLVNKIDKVKSELLTIVPISESDKPNHFEISVKRLGVAKNILVFKLVHKRARRRDYSIRNSIKTLFSAIFTPSSGKINTELAQTLFSKKAFWGYKDYSVDLGGYNLVGYFLAETRRKSVDLLSPIVELEEKEEDSEDLPADKKSKLSKQIVYEESSAAEGKNYEKHQFIISKLEKLVHSFIKEYLDLLTSANCQLLTEANLEHNFKKLATRLELLKTFSTDNQGPQVYLKLLTSLNKVVEEELVNKAAVKNDTTLYQARTKELFKFANRTEVDDLNTTAVNILVAQEAKTNAMIQRSTREFAARIYFEAEFSQYFGDEFEIHDSQKESPANIEQNELKEIMSAFKGPLQRQGEPSPAEALAIRDQNYTPTPHPLN